MILNEEDIKKAARYHVRESNECEVMDTYMAHEDTFLEGAKWADSQLQERIEHLETMTGAWQNLWAEKEQEYLEIRSNLIQGSVIFLCLFIIVIGFSIL